LNSQGQDKIPKLKSDKINVSAVAKAVIKIHKCCDFCSFFNTNVITADFLPVFGHHAKRPIASATTLFRVGGL